MIFKCKQVFTYVNKFVIDRKILVFRLLGFFLLFIISKLFGFSIKEILELLHMYFQIFVYICIKFFYLFINYFYYGSY
jgi:hypothetical protein